VVGRWNPSFRNSTKTTNTKTVYVVYPFISGQCFEVVSERPCNQREALVFRCVRPIACGSVSEQEKPNIFPGVIGCCNASFRILIAVNKTFYLLRNFYEIGKKSATTTTDGPIDNSVRKRNRKRMAYVNWVTYEAQLKVVYYGPAYAGKTTSLRYLSLRLQTDVKELPTADDRSVFFEYTQSQKLPANNLEVKFLYWTLPGQQKYRRTRHLVLAATDAVVFVADSQYEAAARNLEMLNDLEELLSDRGMCLEGRQNLALQQIPIVFFYNKRDLTDIMPIQYMDTLFGLQSWQAPRFTGEATAGKNVVRAANAAATLSLARLEEKIYGPENQDVPAGAE
jgi:mutual gliding-motility protein MglA